MYMYNQCARFAETKLATPPPPYPFTLLSHCHDCCPSQLHILIIQGGPNLIIGILSVMARTETQIRAIEGVRDHFSALDVMPQEFGYIG